MRFPKAKLTASFVALAGRIFPCLLALGGALLQAGDTPPERVPSLVEWTVDTTYAASSGDAFRGMLLARHCEHCHGAEGFSPQPATPNLAGMDQLAIWKQLQDFRTHKRQSRVMAPIAESLSGKSVADLVAYYSKLPVFGDRQDNRAFPASAPDLATKGVAWRLITFGDGERGIPPCQACHGPEAYRPGVPSLMTQNGEYIQKQLEAFADSSRANDINESMRTIAGLLTESERHALADYYGSGLGSQPGSASGGK